MVLIDRDTEVSKDLMNVFGVPENTGLFTEESDEWEWPDENEDFLYVDEEEDNRIVREFISNVYTTIEGVELEPDLENKKIKFETCNFSSDLMVSLDGALSELVIKSEFYDCTSNYPIPFGCICIDDFVSGYLEAIDFFAPEPEEEWEWFIGDEDDDYIEEDCSYSKFSIEEISSDLSVVTVSKLMFDDTLIGYRFWLTNGCADISIDKGRELGFAPYKISKIVKLKEKNGLLVSDYECDAKVLFPDVSDDDALCKKLFGIILSSWIIHSSYFHRC